MPNVKGIPPPSEWKRMSEKLNGLRSSSLRNNEYLLDADGMDAVITTGLTKPEIDTVLDFRQVDGLDQYLVTWKCNSTGDLRTKWETEKFVETIGIEALLKYWIKSSTYTDRNGAKQISSSTKHLFTKKLLNWATKPSSSSTKFFVSNSESSSGYSSPSKKKRRLRGTELDDSKDNLPGSIAADRITQGLIGISSKNNGVGSSPASGDFTNLVIFPTALQTIITREDINDLADAPQCEIGKVIACQQIAPGKADAPHNSYMVAWFYLAYETVDTLGIQNEILHKYFSPQSSKEQIERFQLHRKKYGMASLKESRFGMENEIGKLESLLSPSSSSDSEFSDDASTHPPSVLELHHSQTKGDFDDDVISSISSRVATKLAHAECQTVIDLNPNVCLYCQSRLGEGERLSSLRQRNTIKIEVEEGENKERKLATQNSTVAIVKQEPMDDGDDDDMVDIEYEVEQILDYRKEEGTNVDQYLIRWKGFTAHYDTWEPTSNLNCCDKALVIFYVNRVAQRKLMETKLIKSATSVSYVKKGSTLPPLPPIPELVMDKLVKAAPVSDQEVEMAFKISKTVTKNSKWKKMQLRQMLMEMLGESTAAEIKRGSSRHQQQQPEPLKFDLKEARHQLLMLESERRKESTFIDLKEWEKQLNRITKGRPEIVVENNFDLTGPPKDFRYINDNVIGEGVTFRDDPLEGCDCEDLCVKDKSLCCPGKHDKVLAYNSFKRLRVHPGYPIYECNKRCKCGPDCANRVVQDGTASLSGTKLCIFRTPNERGWGVKTLKKIKRGSFVCLYAGEIITTEEAENRGQIYENLLGSSYLFDLDYYNYDDKNSESESCPYTIDATKMGNVAHFINHSCDPNLCVFNVWADCVDQNLPKLAFFALRDIDREEELTYDYGTHDADDSLSKSPGPKFNSVVLSTPTKATTTPTKKSPRALAPTDEDDGESEILDPALLSLSSPAKNRMKPATMSAVRRPCLCGAKNCRKVLF